MTDVYRTEPASPVGLAEMATLSWRAVIAGAIANGALTLTLLAVGSAVGFSSVSPWSNSGVSATTFHVGTGLFLVVTAMLAGTIGGYLSGRLRDKWTRVHTYEAQFRDTAHGFLSWALATIVGAAVLGGAATYLVGGTPASSAPAANRTTDYYATLLMQPAGAARAPGATAAQSDREARQIFAHDAAAADFPASDRTYLAQLVSAQTGLNQQDAEKRVSDVITRAKAEADRARKVAAALSIWIAISMFVGAFCAGLAAIEGGQLRDRRWKGVFGTRDYEEARIES